MTLELAVSRLVAAGMRLVLVARNERSNGKWCTVCGAVKKGQRYDHAPGCPVAEMEQAIYQATRTLVWNEE